MDVVNYLVKTNISINGQVSEKSDFRQRIKLRAHDRHTDVQYMYNLRCLRSLNSPSPSSTG